MWRIRVWIFSIGTVMFYTAWILLLVVQHNTKFSNSPKFPYILTCTARLFSGQDIRDMREPSVTVMCLCYQYHLIGPSITSLSTYYIYSLAESSPDFHIIYSIKAKQRPLSKLVCNTYYATHLNFTLLASQNVPGTWYCLFNPNS